MPKPSPIVGVVLAGGQAKRLGGIDKGLVEIGGRPLVAWIVDALAPQVDSLLINANRNEDLYGQFGFPVVPDRLPNHQGPLAGIAAGLAQVPPDGAALTVPYDSPAPPPDLAARLSAALEAGEGELAVAHDGKRLQPVHALIPVALRVDLEAFLARGGRKVELWLARHRVAMVDFSDRRDGFLNLNRPEDLERVQQCLALSVRPD
jgi:molybdenum cofactor guanylyltransferase